MLDYEVVRAAAICLIMKWSVQRPYAWLWSGPCSGHMLDYEVVRAAAICLIMKWSVQRPYAWLWIMRMTPSLPRSDLLIRMPWVRDWPSCAYRLSVPCIGRNTLHVQNTDKKCALRPPPFHSHLTIAAAFLGPSGQTPVIPPATLIIRPDVSVPMVAVVPGFH